MDKKSDLLKLISESTNILITSHESPDRDAVGSLIAMYHILKQLGKTNLKMLLEMKSSIHEEFLDGMDDIIYDNLVNHLTGVDLLIVVDVNRLSRITKTDVIDKNIKIAIIDHHDSPTDMHPDVYLKSQYSSNCEGIYMIFHDEVKIDKEIAKPLLMGIYSDTGGFKYDGVYKNTLEVVYNLVNTGINISQIVRESAAISVDMLLASRSILNHTTISKEKRMFYGYLPRDISDKFNLEPKDIDLIKDITIGMLLDVEDIDFGLLIKPRPTGDVTISARSKENTACTALSIVELFDGGGHINSAGARLDIKDPKAALHYVLKKLKEVGYY